MMDENRLLIDLLNVLLAHPSAKTSHETILIDSSLCTSNQHVWQETSKGGRWERVTIKYHVLLTLSGCVVAPAVTDVTVMSTPC